MNEAAFLLVLLVLLFEERSAPASSLVIPGSSAAAPPVYAPPVTHPAANAPPVPSTGALQWHGSGGWQAKAGGVFAGAAVKVASAVPGGGSVVKAGLALGPKIAVDVEKGGAKVVHWFKSFL